MPFQFKTRRRVPHEGNPRAEHILRAAQHVFLRDGATGFSGRTVAAEAGVSLGSLQHFFPTMDGLLAAMLEFVINEYDEAYERALRALPLNAEARLRAVVEYLITDIWRSDTRKFFFGLWALGCHNDFAEQLVAQMYDYHRHSLAVFIGAARPDLSDEQCVDVAMQVAALIDGSMLYTGARTRRTASKAQISALLADGVMRLLSLTVAPRPGNATVAPEGAGATSPRDRVRRAGPTTQRTHATRQPAR